MPNSLTSTALPSCTLLEDSALFPETVSLLEDIWFSRRKRCCLPYICNHLLLLLFRYVREHSKMYNDKSLSFMPEFHLATLLVNNLISTKSLWPSLWHLKCQKSQNKQLKLLNWRTTQMIFSVIHNECYGHTVLCVVLPWFLFRSNYPPHFSYVLHMWVRITSLKLCQCYGQGL